MRDALSSLTNRGRAFLAGGITTVVCGLVLGQWTMARFGLLVVLLPLVAAVVLSRSQHRLTLRREITPRVVVAGQSATVHLTLSNEGALANGTLLLEELVPYALGQRPRFVVNGVGRGWTRHLTYPVRSEVRGRHEVGPMTVRVTDPFGMVELGRTFHSTTPLVATPRTVALTRSRPAQSWAGTGHSRPRSFSVGHAEDVTVREYQLGDDVRRVHWRSSARTGELMVRREEQPWQARAVVVLDTRLGAHRGRGPASSFEGAVSAAASIALELAAQGHEVQVAGATRLLSTASSPGADPGDRGPLLESLAVVELEETKRFDLSWLSYVPAGTQVVAVLGSLDPGDQEAVQRLERHGPSPMAVVIDVESWTIRSRPSATATRDLEATLTSLSRSGWRVAPLGPTDQLDDVWQQVTR